MTQEATESSPAEPAAAVPADAQQPAAAQPDPAAAEPVFNGGRCLVCDRRLGIPYYETGEGDNYVICGGTAPTLQPPSFYYDRGEDDAIAYFTEPAAAAAAQQPPPDPAEASDEGVGREPICPTCNRPVSEFCPVDCEPERFMDGESAAGDGWAYCGCGHPGRGCGRCISTDTDNWVQADEDTYICVPCADELGIDDICIECYRRPCECEPVDNDPAAAAQQPDAAGTDSDSESGTAATDSDEHSLCSQCGEYPCEDICLSWNAPQTRADAAAAAEAHILERARREAQQEMSGIAAAQQPDSQDWSQSSESSTVPDLNSPLGS